MRAIAITPGKGTPHLAERPEPGEPAPNQVVMRVLEVGICGTDREEAAGGRALAPAGAQELVIGHEMFGRVERVGGQVRRVAVGDYAVFTVRRGCGRCAPCAMNRSDMCLTGGYHERGIWGQDGYQTERAMDDEQYVVRVPAELASLGVLTEPCSVAEKAIDEAVRLQTARMPQAAAAPNWLFGRRCLVAGLGPIGLLAALALRLRGAEVHGLDIVPENSPRPAWLEAIGGHYVNGQQVKPENLDTVIGAVDLIFEAAGIAALSFELLDALAPSGVYVLTGIPGGDRPLQIPGGALIRRLVLNNQAMVGSVNAARDHYQIAVDDLYAAHLRWPGHLEKLITHRHAPADFATAFTHHSPDEIKAIVAWN